MANAVHSTSGERAQLAVIWLPSGWGLQMVHNNCKDLHQKELEALRQKLREEALVSEE